MTPFASRRRRASPTCSIAFSSDRAGYREYYHQERSRAIYVMRPNGSDIQQVMFNPNQDYEPLAMRDGRVLYSSYRFYGQDGSVGPLPGELSLQRIETVFRTILPDGSGDNVFYGAMRGPFYTPIRFVLLDENKRPLVHETAFNYVRPGETKGCVGCHEPKNVAVHNAVPTASLRAPAKAVRKRGDLIYQGRINRSYSVIVRD